MSTAIKNLELMLSDYFIVDPSIISRRLDSEVIWFLTHKYNPKRIVLPTSIYNGLKYEEYGKIAEILKKWRWRLPIEEIEDWISSPTFVEMRSRLLEISSPTSEFWKLEKDPPIVEEIAEEIREVAVRLKAPLVATSRSFKRWLNKKVVTTLEVSSEEYKEFKRNLRREYQRSLKVRLAVRGLQWSLGGVFLITVIVALQAGSLPVVLSSLLPSMATGTANLLYQAIVIDP